MKWTLRIGGPSLLGLIGVVSWFLLWGAGIVGKSPGTVLPDSVKIRLADTLDGKAARSLARRESSAVVIWNLLSLAVNEKPERWLLAAQYANVIGKTHLALRWYERGLKEVPVVRRKEPALAIWRREYYQLRFHMNHTDLEAGEGLMNTFIGGNLEVANAERARDGHRGIPHTLLADYYIDKHELRLAENECRLLREQEPLLVGTYWWLVALIRGYRQSELFDGSWALVFRKGQRYEQESTRLRMKRYHKQRMQTWEQELVKAIDWDLSPEEKVRHAQAALRLAPQKTPFMYCALANVLISLRRLDQAVTAAEAALRLDQTYGEAYILLGASYLQKGDRERAGRMLSQVRPYD